MIWMPILMLAAPQPADAPKPIMTINVAKLPATYKSAPVVHLEFTPKGEVATCTLTQPSGSDAIDKVVCDQVKTTVKLKGGKKAPAARDATVEFVADAPPAPKG